MGLCASNGANQVQAAPGTGAVAAAKVASAPANVSAPAGAAQSSSTPPAAAAAVASSGAAAASADTVSHAESGHVAWQPPASRERLEAARFREKKAGFQGFRVAEEDEEASGGSGRDLGEAAPKSPEDVARARTNVGDLLALSDDAQLDALFGAMRVVEKKAGEVVFEPGKDRGYFYLAISGEFTLDGAESKYANQQGLMSTKPSEATFACSADGTLWLIDRLTYQNVLVEQMKMRGQQNEELLAQIPTLAPLPQSQREQIASVLVKEEFKKGEYLMRQGEAGDKLFFIRGGHVSVRQSTLKRSSADFSGAAGAAGGAGGADTEAAAEVARRGPGEYIGEGALLTDEPRIADVVAESDTVQCLSLQREDFKELMGPLTDLMHHNFCCKVLKGVSIFADLTQENLMSIASVLETVTHTAGDYVVHQGEQGGFFYIIKEGTVECTRLESEDQEQPDRIGTLIKGDYFGEGALLTNDARRANVVAAKTGDSDKVVLWGLSRKNFETLRGVQEALTRNFKKRKDTTKEGKAQTEWEDLERIKVLGSGSYGTVTLVRHKVTGETYALKRIRKATVVAKKQQRFVKNERELLAVAASPFIVNMIRTFNKGDSVWMLTEVCLGGELYTLMKDTVDAKPWDENEDAEDDYGTIGCFEIGTQCRFFTACVVLAIEALHSQGIIHRDIKPENLLLDDRGYLKLADFGFAKMVQDHRTYSLCGTPEYTAPEVYKRCGHSKGVDWWALGVILYEMASGFSPFHVLSQNSWDCYIEVSKYEKFYPNIQFPRNFSDELCNLLLRLMHPNPTKRYGTRKCNAKQVKMHPFFGPTSIDPTKTDWAAIGSLEYQLPQDFRPKASESGLDAGNFEECDDRHDLDEETLLPGGYEASEAGGDWETGF